jgi:hypothetical protein
LTSRFSRLGRENIRTIPISTRSHKVSVEHFSDLHAASFIERLPAQLKGSDWKEFCGSLADAFTQRKPVAIMLGAHVVKVGVTPFLIDWIGRGMISAVAFNGATAIHDLEIALWGETSEDVEAGLGDGSFGMVDETPAAFAEALEIATAEDMGLGEALGVLLERRKAPHAKYSMIAACHRSKIPLSVHVALGTDTIHQHPAISGARLGEASLADFEVFCRQISLLQPGSVVMNLGSAVILPEVFLKALTTARNLGHPVEGLVTADFSMIPQYRPAMNVVGRPTRTGGGKGYSFTGYHELNIPLLYDCVEELIREPDVQV